MKFSRNVNNKKCAPKITKNFFLERFGYFLTLKIDFKNQILALFDSYFWLFNKSDEKIKFIFVISAIIPSIWNVFIKFCWNDENLTVIWAYSFLDFQENFQPLCFFTFTNDFFPPYSLLLEPTHWLNLKKISAYPFIIRASPCIEGPPAKKAGHSFIVPQKHPRIFSLGPFKYYVIKEMGGWA